MQINTIKYLFCLCLLPGIVVMANAQNSSSSFPKIAVTWDFNTLFAGDNAHGLKLQVYSNHHFFSDNTRKRLSNENTLAYAYGLGLGAYTVQSLNTAGSAEDDVYLFNAQMTISYRNKSFFEPFASLYPGVAWGAKSGFYINPAVGVDITSFHINRNWNSKLLQTYVQFRMEYNTLLTSVFLGVGVILHFQ